MDLGDTLVNQIQQVLLPHFIEEENEAETDLLKVIWLLKGQVQEPNSSLPHFQTPPYPPHHPSSSEDCDHGCHLLEDYFIPVISFSPHTNLLGLGHCTRFTDEDAKA